MPYVAHRIKESIMSNPISPKVVAAAVGAGAGATVSKLLLWGIGVVAYGVPADAGHVAAAVAAVPDPITAALGLALVVAGAAIPGYKVTDPLRATAARALLNEDGSPVVA